MKRILYIYVLLLLASFCNAKSYLFNNGKSDYKIVLPSTASTSEKTASKELQEYIKQISNVTLPIVSSIPAKGKFIYIGYNKNAAKTKPASNSETYTYLTKNANLYIWGGSGRGTMYGVFSFLENELGVRWYTQDYTKVPKKSVYAMPVLKHSETPCIKHRLDFYHMPLNNPVWCAHNKQNDAYSTYINEYGNISACLGIHTMFTLVSPETYFSSHPEYFCEINGTRTSKDGQLCLTNKNVLSLVRKAILKTIKENPDYWVYDVSQMDNNNYCQCESCTKIAKKYGGQSGLMVWFINQVADTVMRVYPNKYISTFAYMYTRHTPKGIKPRNNVVIRLCDIECCVSHPLSSTTCEKNKEFMKDLKGWGQIAKNIYIWDYVVNFFGYLIPYPNFSTLPQNIKTFATNHAIGILEEGAHETEWAEFSEMRQWILAKLLWNPNQNVDKLAKEFCDGYYGDASQNIYTYYKLTQQIPSDCHIVFHSQYDRICYGNEFIKQAESILTSAANSVKGNQVLEKRVNRILAQIYYIHALHSGAKAKGDGIYMKLKEILKNDPTNPREGKSDLDEVLQMSEGYI